MIQASLMRCMVSTLETGMLRLREVKGLCSPHYQLRSGSDRTGAQVSQALRLCPFPYPGAPSLITQ